MGVLALPRSGFGVRTASIAGLSLFYPRASKNCDVVFARRYSAHIAACYAAPVLCVIVARIMAAWCRILLGGILRSASRAAA